MINNECKYCKKDIVGFTEKQFMVNMINHLYSNHGINKLEEFVKEVQHGSKNRRKKD